LIPQTKILRRSSSASPLSQSVIQSVKHPNSPSSARSPNTPIKSNNPSTTPSRIHSKRPSISLSHSQPIQPVNQSNNQSNVSPSVNQPITPSPKSPTGQPINHSIDQSVTQSNSQSGIQSIHHQTSAQSTNQSNNQSTITVAIRVKPLTAAEIDHAKSVNRSISQSNRSINEPIDQIGTVSIIDDTTIQLTDPRHQSISQSTNQSVNQFQFDYVFSDQSTNQSISQTITHSIVDRIMAGENATLIAYGQTGSGELNNQTITESVTRLSVNQSVLTSRSINQSFYVLTCCYFDHGFID
jgi:hypothetical protein